MCGGSSFGASATTGSSVTRLPSRNSSRDSSCSGSHGGTLKASVYSYDFIPTVKGVQPIHQDVTYEFEQYPEDKTEKDLETQCAPAIRHHMQDFLAAIGTRGRPVADIEEGYISTSSCILANLAMKLGRTLAWDPKTQTEKWRVDYGIPGSGGVLSTAGNLLVQGTINKTVAIYRADTGAKLWEMDVDQAAVAGPITYMIDGEQYIAINAGWGGSPVYNLNKNGPFRTSTAKLLVFKLDAKGVTLPPPPPPAKLPPPPPLRAPESQVTRGRELNQQTCVRCHGEDAIGGVKDLRWMTPETRAMFDDIVLKGIYRERGMVSFADVLKPEDAAAIHQYLIARANEDYADAAAKGN